MGRPVFAKQSISLVKKHLSPALLKSLEHKKTRSGYTLANAINSGIVNPDSAIGIYAGDEESYQTFSEIFNPVISEYHGIEHTRKHTSDIKPISLLPVDPEGKFIKSTRIRVARNLAGFSFPGHITLSRRREMEKKIISALSCLENDLKGKYYSFEHMEKADTIQLQQMNALFKKGDRFQAAAGINSDFPKSRGVFLSFDKTFMIWVNEEDHLRIISIERSSDISRVFNRLCRSLATLNSTLDFAWDETFGNLTSCPTNIGTAMRAGVHIQLEKLEQKKEILFELARTYNLQIRGTSGEKTKVRNAVFDVSNRQRLGASESALIKNLHTGLLAIIKAEKNL